VKHLQAHLSIAILCLALSLGLSCSRGDHSDSSPAETARDVVVQRGWAFETALHELSVDEDLRSVIIATLKGVFDFRKCMPGDRAVLISSQDDEFLRFEYHKSRTTYFVVEPSDSGLVAAEVNLETEKRISFIEGSVVSSLYESVIDSGERGDLAFAISDVFEWDIDFNVETRKNDRYSVLFVKEYLKDEFIDYGPVLFATYEGHVGSYEATRFEDSKGHHDFYDRKGKSLRKVFLKSPLQYRRISSYFSKRRYHPILKIYCPHHGIDYAAPVGTPVSAIGDGTVAFAGWKGGYGKFVQIRHSNGYTSGYGHLSGYARGIRKGRRVRQGQLIGYVGNTGRSTGPHLHFEMKRHGNFVNPLRIRIPAADPVSENRMAVFLEHRKKTTSLAKAYELLAATKELADIRRRAVKGSSPDSAGTSSVE
jgi:murein DD-endopeptidase MepM/ murein hydrolase activator NlpD